MPKRTRQAEASGYIRWLLYQRGFEIDSRSLKIAGDRQWLVFERAGRQVGIDSETGIWVRSSPTAEWRSIETSCTVSGALEAVDFLTKG